MAGRVGVAVLILAHLDPAAFGEITRNGEACSEYPRVGLESSSCILLNQSLGLCQIVDADGHADDALAALPGEVGGDAGSIGVQQNNAAAIQNELASGRTPLL